MGIGISHYNYSNTVYLFLVMIVLVQSVDVLKKGSTSGDENIKKVSDSFIRWRILEYTLSGEN